MVCHTGPGLPSATGFESSSITGMISRVELVTQISSAVCKTVNGMLSSRQEMLFGAALVYRFLSVQDIAQQRDGFYIAKLPAAVIQANRFYAGC